MMAVSGMADKKARLLQIENQIEINRQNTPEFLLEYQKSILLELKKQGILSDTQCQICIERLIKQSAVSDALFKGNFL